MAVNDCRAALLGIATPLFSERGYSGVSVREIAALAGVNVSMISYYFGGKEGLYGAVLDEQFAVLRRVEDIARMEAEPLQKIESYVRATAARYRQHPHLLGLYMHELTHPTPCFATIVKPAVQGVVRTLRDCIADGMARQRFRDGLDPGDMALALAGMINFYFLLAPATGELVDQSPARDEELIRHIMDFFANGVLPRP